MSTSTQLRDLDQHEDSEGAIAPRTESGVFRAVGISVLVALASVALFPMWQDAWNLWSNDPLRSIGAIFPLVSLLLVLWRWREIGYRTDGSYWGLLPILLAVVGARVDHEARFEVLIAGHRVGLLHPGLTMFSYGVGCALLFGGVALLRRAIVPLCLLLLLNPVPRAFNAHVDLPLQTLSANTARGFAHLIGLKPTGAQLKMMFAPDFGMMIVPGCNGVRGAVTLGYLALIFGYTRRLRLTWLALLGFSAFLMGYVLNLTRLCVLVVYYRIGLSIVSIQKYGVEIDYVIGCTIFLVATLSIGVAVRVYQLKSGTAPESFTPVPAASSDRKSLAVKAICFAALAIAFIVPQMRAIAAAKLPEPSAADVIAAMPTQVGRYRLTRTWTQSENGSRVDLVLGDYLDEANGKRFTLGFWIGWANHFIANSKLYQGVLPEWNGSFDATALGAQVQGSVPVRFRVNFYDDGVTRNYDAETSCGPDECAENLIMDKKTGLIFTSPSVKDLAVAHSTRRLPLLLRREWTDNAMPEPALRGEFEADARDFIAHLEIAPILQKAGSH